MKKVVIGMPSCKYIKFDELKQLCIDYGDNIDCWYASMPYKNEYQSRGQLFRDTEQERSEGLDVQLRIIKRNNLQFELAVNNFRITEEEAKSEIKDVERFISDFGMPDRFVAVGAMIPLLAKYNIPITYSYNNNGYDENYLQYCDRVVIGNRDIRNIKLMERFRDNSKQVELLVNNGCHFACTKWCGKECWTAQEKIVQAKGKYQCLAEQSLLPYELEYLKDYIDCIKISSRPSDYYYLNDTLEAYTHMWEKDEFLERWDLTKKINWYLFCRLQPLAVFFNADEVIDVNTVLELKDKIWGSVDK